LNQIVRKAFFAQGANIGALWFLNLLYNSLV
jgi:hypothetical protein